jgi:hypothetical protein
VIYSDAGGEIILMNCTFRHCIMTTNRPCDTESSCNEFSGIINLKDTNITMNSCLLWNCTTYDNGGFFFLLLFYIKNLFIINRWFILKWNRKCNDRKQPVCVLQYRSSRRCN